MNLRCACLIAPLVLAPVVAADTIVQEGFLSGSAGAPNEHYIDLLQFDTLDGTRVLNFVRLEFTNTLFAESVTNGAGGFVQASASLSTIYSFLGGGPIADVLASIETTVDNSGKPVATLYLDIDEVAVEYDSPASLERWIGSGGITLFAIAQMLVTADPPGVIEWGGSGMVEYRVIYDFDLAPPCPADLDESGIVDNVDLAMLLGAWDTAAADIDGDGMTDAADLLLLLAAWGDC